MLILFFPLIIEFSILLLLLFAFYYYLFTLTYLRMHEFNNLNLYRPVTKNSSMVISHLFLSVFLSLHFPS